MRIFPLTTIACLLVAAAANASAQPARTFGVTMAYPASIGVLWQASQRLAIRPDLSVSWSSTESSSDSIGGGLIPPISIETKSDGYTLGVGVSALWTVARWDALRAYVAPRAGYTRLSATTTTRATTTVPPGGVIPGLPTIPTLERTNTSSGYQVGGAFGAQHSLVERFAIFGEVGINYSSSESAGDETVAFLPTIRGRNVGIRSGVGVIFFF